MSLSDAASNFSNLSLTDKSYVRVPSEHSSNAQQDESEPSAGASLTSDRLLKLALPADESDTEKDRYAVVRMPDSYEKAQSIALDVFRRYIPNEVTTHDQILKTSVKNRKGEWCWADILPQEWMLTIKGASDEVGVFYTIPVTFNVPLPMFIVGPVGLVYGVHENHGIKWKISYGYPKNANEVSDIMIDRPKSYQDAIATVQRLDLGYKAGHGNNEMPFKEAIRTKHLKFYMFTSVLVTSELPVASWFKEFPKRAYTDEDIWRTIVPEPGKLLGFTIEDSSPA